MKRKNLRLSKVSELLAPQIYENRKGIPSLFHWYTVLKMAPNSACLQDNGGEKLLLPCKLAT